MSAQKSPLDHLTTIETGVKVSNIVTVVAGVLYFVSLFSGSTLWRMTMLVFVFGSWMYRRGANQGLRYAEALRESRRHAWSVAAAQEYKRGYHKGAEHQRVADLMARESRRRASEYAAEEAKVRATIERKALPPAPPTDKEQP